MLIIEPDIPAKLTILEIQLNEEELKELSDSIEDLFNNPSFISYEMNGESKNDETLLENELSVFFLNKQNYKELLPKFKKLIGKNEINK
jgi:hypothetical protein